MLARTHGNYRQASFHHAHMIRVWYFDNLVCGWTGAWVLPLLGQASHISNYQSTERESYEHEYAL